MKKSYSIGSIRHYGILLTLMFAAIFVSSAQAYALTLNTPYENAILHEIREIRLVLSDINISNSINFLIGIAIAVIAIIATIYNSKKLNRQLSILERETRYRIRPILVRTHYSNGNTFSIRDDDTTDRMLWIKILNSGPLPAVNIERKVRTGIMTDRSESLENVEFTSTMMPSMGPNEYVDNIIRLSDQEYRELTGGSNYFFEMRIEYKEPEHSEKKYHYHILGHFEKGNLIQDSVMMN